jgi:8-oxo-dGTP diphosphatase
VWNSPIDIECAMLREYPSAPIPSVGVVVCKGDKVLLVLRGQEPSRGKWSIPGGVVELGETIREAARREVLEECGLEIDVGDVIDVLDSIVHDEKGSTRYHYTLIDLLATYVGGELRVGSDIDDARWVSEEELTKFDLTKSALPVIRKALKKSKLDFSTEKN